MLRLVRGNYENKYGYLITNRYALSSGPSHDKEFLTIGAPYARNTRILEVVPIPAEMLRGGRFRLLLAYTSLAGAWAMGYRAEEILEIIRREMEHPTYPEAKEV